MYVRLYDVCTSDGSVHLFLRKCVMRVLAAYVRALASALRLPKLETTGTQSGQHGVFVHARRGLRWVHRQLDGADSSRETLGTTLHLSL
jgi:hypothetical protein